MGFMVVIGGVMFASMALLPPMLQTLFGWPVIDTGIILAVRGVGILMSMWVAGQLLGRIDARWLVGTGLLIAAYSLWRSEEHTSELQSLMRISYAVFCLIKKNIYNNINSS